MRYASVLILFASSIAAVAQNKPQLTWSGYVTGSATLYVQGDRVDAQGRQTGAIDRPDFRFQSALPVTRTQVDVTVRRGGGRVTVSEQPVPGNQYTAAIEIDPPGDRPEYYVLDFSWDASGNQSWNRDRQNRSDERGRFPKTKKSGTGELRWTGDVDIQALIEVRGNRVASRAVRGRPVLNEHIDVTSPLPRVANSNVRLIDKSGRGQVELLELPNSQNGYRALIRIQDPQAGQGSYSFRLVWNDSTSGAYSDNGRNYRGLDGNNPGVPPERNGYVAEGYRARSDSGYINNSRYARWSARVDGHIRVAIQGNRATVQTISGQPVANMNLDLGGGPGLLYGNLADVQVRKLQGRGDVRIVQMPDDRNSYLAFEINDAEGGPDYYEVKVTWRQP